MLRIFSRRRNSDDVYHLRDEVFALREGSRVKDYDAVQDIAFETLNEASGGLGFTPNREVSVAIFRFACEMLVEEALAYVPPPFTAADLTTFQAEVSLRTSLKLAKRHLLRQEYFLRKWREAMVGLVRVICADLPDHLSVDPNEDGTVEQQYPLSPTVPLYSYVRNVPELLQRILVTTFAKDLDDDGVFFAIRDALNMRLLAASEISPDEVVTGKDKLVFPLDLEHKPETYLIAKYVQGTPFETLLTTQLPQYIPDSVRFEHTHIVAGTGHGKTQTLQYLITSDLERVVDETRSLVVMDSQGDLLETLMRSSLFEDLGIRERFVYINPTDLKQPVALNLFDFDLSSDISPVERETILNGTIELYEYFFGALLGAELTQKQGVVFRYIAILLMHVPNANIHTLRELMEDGEKFRPYMASLDGSARIFFETRFFERTFSETKKQILTRLWGVLSNSTLDRMMSASKNSVNLFEALQRGSIVFINTAQDFLGHEGSVIFSRMFIALLGQALMRRAAVPKHLRTSTYVYIDEAQEVVDLTITRLLAQVRKYRGALTFAHQNLDQLSPEIRSAVLANTSVKLAGGLSAKDASSLSGDFRCDADFLLSQRKTRDTTSFACYVKNVTEKAVNLSVPLGYLESFGAQSDASYLALLELSRSKYGAAPPKATLTLVETTHSVPEVPVVHVQNVAAAPEAGIRPFVVPPIAVDPAHTLVFQEPAIPKLRTLGKGGAKHKYLQHLLKELGEARGFRASIEEPITNGLGSVDVLLTRDGLKLAFEISVTTTKDHELCNVEKCLAEHYSRVVMLAATKRHLTGLEKFISLALESDERERVSFLLPEDLASFLDGFGTAEVKAERVVKGYTVRSRVSVTTPDDAVIRRRALAQMVAQKGVIT